MKLGPFEIEHPFILAPMAGITHSPFRRLMRELGSSITISELVSANGLKQGGERTLKFLNFHELERPLGIQIFGEDTENLCYASKLVEEKGADFVDLNLGCPVPKVVKKGAGSAMCRNPLELGRTLEAMVKSVKIPVTIKIRTGWDEGTRNAQEIVNVAHNSGIAWVAIHGRTRAQGYSGDADWDFISEVKSRSPLPIIGNGDLTTAELALDRFQKSGVDAVLIGRGALRNPFIFKQSIALLRGDHAPSVEMAAFFRVIETHWRYLQEFFGPEGSVLHLKKFLAWYASGFPYCHDFRRRVFTLTSGQELWDLAQEFFLGTNSARDFAFLSEPFLMGGHG